MALAPVQQEVWLWSLKASLHVCRVAYNLQVWGILPSTAFKGARGPGRQMQSQQGSHFSAYKAVANVSRHLNLMPIR